MSSIERSSKGMSKHGSAADGTNAAHILSYEILDTADKHRPGPRYGAEKQEQIQREMNQDHNLRIKTREGNMYGNDGYSGDRAKDIQIENAMDGDNKQISQAAAKRVQQQWEQAQKMNLPNKKALRDQFSQLKDPNGHSIVRKNSPLNKK